MSSSTLARVMQVVLAPLLLLWLGSLYNTRHRESLLIGRMKDVSALYPHLINVYPVVLRGNTAWDPPRKKSWSKYVLLVFGMPAIYALIRIALLLIFVGPPVAFYWLSIFLVGETAYSPFFLGMGVVVFLFTMAVLICELLPWHVSKKFSVVTRSPI